MDALLDRWPDKVERFNKMFLPGTPVVFVEPNGMRVDTRIQFPALIMSDGVPVIWLERVTGYCDLRRVIVK